MAPPPGRLPDDAMLRISFAATAVVVAFRVDKMGSGEQNLLFSDMGGGKVPRPTNEDAIFEAKATIEASLPPADAYPSEPPHPYVTDVPDQKA